MNSASEQIEIGEVSSVEQREETPELAEAETRRKDTHRNDEIGRNRFVHLDLPGLIRSQEITESG